MTKSRFKNERGELDLGKIERTVKQFFLINQKRTSGTYHFQIDSILCSEAMKIAEYFEAEERKDQYEITTTERLSLSRGLFDRDKISCAIEIYPKTPKNNH